MKLAIAILALLASMSGSAAEVSIDLHRVSLVDLVRVVYGDVLKRPFVIDSDALDGGEAVTLSLPKVAPDQLEKQVRAIAELRGYSLDSFAGVAVLKRRKEKREILVYRPRHRPGAYLADVVQQVTGARSLAERGISDQVEGIERKPASRSSAAGAIDQAEDDQLAFLVPSDEVAKVQGLLEQLDQAFGQVVLKAAVFEVGKVEREGGALRVLASVLGGRVGLQIGSAIADGGRLTVATGGIEAVLSALDNDDRFRIVSRPQVRVKSGGEARFAVGSDVPTIGTIQLDRNGNPVQSVEYRQSGIILKAKPEVREDSIELAIDQELSSFVATTTGVNNSPTLIRRSVATNLVMHGGEVVVLAGLSEQRQEQQKSRLGFFGFPLADQAEQRETEIVVLLEAQRI